MTRREMLSLEEIRTLCKDDPEVQAMTDERVSELSITAYRLAHLLLEPAQEEAKKGSDKDE